MKRIKLPFLITLLLFLFLTGQHTFAAGAKATAPGVQNAPPSPFNLKAEMKKDNIKLTWDIKEQDDEEKEDDDNEDRYIVSDDDKIARFIIERSDNTVERFRSLTSVEGDKKEYRDGEIAPNNTYYYRVMAINEEGSSGYSNIASASTQQEPVLPAAPTGLAATATSATTINLSWNDNADNETGYVVQRSASAESGFATIAEPDANATGYSDTELAENTTYYYRVYAVNEGGNSGFSNTATATTLQQATPPAAPTALAASAVSASSVNLSWNDNADNETGYVVQRSTSAESGFTTIAEPGANATSHTDTELADNTTYYYRVYAVNEAGNSGFSNTAAATTLQEAAPPAAPSGLAASAVSMSSINLSWNDNADNETGYVVQRSASAESGFAIIAEPGADATSHTDTELADNTTYYYRVYAVNEAGNSAFSNTASATTEQKEDEEPEDTPPAAPTDLSATAASSSSISLSWTDNAENETGYLVQRSASAESGFSTVSEPDANATSFTDTGLTESTTYYYRVYAVNAAGNSGASNTANATTEKEAEEITPPAAPTGLAASAASASSILLSWTDNASNEVSYSVERSTTSGTGFTEVATLDADATSYTDRDLSANTTYYYRVIAINAAGSSEPSNEASAQTTAEVIEIAAPTGLTGEAVSVTEIVLRWTDNSDNEANFEIERASNEEGTFNTVAVLSSNTNTYVDLNLRPNTNYTYRVRAVNGDSFSEFSNQVIVSTQPEVTPQIEVVNKNFPKFFDLAAKEVKVSIEFSNAILIEQVLVYYRGIRASEWKSEAIESEKAVYEFMLTPSLLDELGVEYYFEITAKTGEKTISDVGITYLAYSGEGLVLENLKNGTTQDAYQMISIPLQLESPDMGAVFNDDLGSYDIDKWRLVRYENGELVENTRGLDVIEPGKGYWLIMTDKTPVSTGKGNVVQASKEAPFRITLQQGWNQIGNPYPFDIQWGEVLAYNGNPPIGNLIIYDNTYKETSALAAYRGAYVFSETDMEISIPVNNNLDIKKDGKSATGKQQTAGGLWEVNLRLTSPDIAYNLGGFGMHGGASKSKDRFDRVSPPRHFDYITVDFEHPEYFVPFFTRDIVPEAENQVWKFSVTSSQSIPAVTLQWGKPDIDDKKLILYDVAAQKPIDMLHEASYRIALKDTRDFQVFYGSEEFIAQKLKPHTISMGDVFPNPFVDGVQIPFTLPESDKSYQVNIEIYNELGQLIQQPPTERFPGGFHKVSLQLPQAIPGKMYFFKFYVRTGNKIVYTGSEKIIKGR